MEREGSGEDSAEEDQLPEKISEEYFQEVNDKVHELIDKLEKTGEQNSADIIRQMQKVFNRVRSDLTASEQKIVNFQEEAVLDQVRLEEANKQARADQDVIQRLRVSMENAWKQVDCAHARELEAQQEVVKLREKLETYEAPKSVKKSEIPKNVFLDDSTELESTAFKEKLIKEREELTSEIKELNRRLQIQRMYTTEMENICSGLEEKNKYLLKLLDNASNDILKEKKQVELLNRELNEAKESKKATEDKQKQIKEQCERYMKTNVHLNLQILAAKSTVLKIKSKFATASNKLVKTAAELENVIDVKDKALTELSQKVHMLKIKEEECTKIKLECANLSRANDGLVKKLVAAQQAKSKADGDILRYKTQISNCEKEIETVKKSIEGYTKRISELIKERDLAKTELVQVKKRASIVKDKVAIIEQQRDDLRAEMEGHITKERDSKIQTSRFQKEIDQLLERIEFFEDKIYTLQTENQLKRNYIIELKKTIAEEHAKFLSVQTLVDTVRNERNLLQKNLVTITKERDDNKQQLAISFKCQEELREKIITKEAEISKLEHLYEKSEKDKHKIKKELENSHVVLQNTRSELSEKRQENDNLYKILAEEQKKLSKINRDLDEIEHAKAQLASQLTKRNEEILSLNEKIGLMQSEIDRGNLQYDAKLEDMRLLKIEIQNLRSEQEILRKDRENAAQCRRELLRMHRVLNQERVKARALQDEMLTPMNVHRWRALRGSDPEKVILLERVQSLQKRVLSQNVVAIQRESSLQEAQRLYNSLKEFMLKLPSYKVKAQLNEAKHALGKNEKKMKALVAELNAKEVDDKSKDCVVEDLRNTLDTTKRELTREKKKKQKLLEERHFIAHMQMQCFSASMACSKTTGGGFKMLQSS